MKIRSNLTHLEIASSLIAAMTHDLDHPGVNQTFLVATSNHLASLYKVICCLNDKYMHIYIHFTIVLPIPSTE